MADRRSDPTGRTAVLGCSAALTLLAGVLALGTLAYIGGVMVVRTSTGFRAATAAIEAREASQPVLGLPIHHGYWLGIQLARNEHDVLELQVRSTSTGALSAATVYSTFVPGPDGLEPTSVLITARNGVIDVLADNERAAHAREEARTTSLLDETRSLRDSRRFAEALVLADEVVLLTPDSAAAYALRSTIRLALDDPNGAAEDARMALSLQPEHAEALLAMAEVHRHTEDWPACIEVATTRLRDTPRDGAAWRVRAHCYLGLNKRREAAAGAREACDLGDPEGCALAKRLD